MILFVDPKPERDLVWREMNSRNLKTKATNNSPMKKERKAKQK